MSQDNQNLNKENNTNLSEKENIMITSNSNFIDNNDNTINITIKEKEDKIYNLNTSLNNEKNNYNENNNKNKYEEKNNSIISNNKSKIYSQSSSEKKGKEIISTNKKKNKSIDLNNLELDYMQMSKQLEDLRNESSFLKNKINEMSQKQGNLNKNNKNGTNNAISFNKATFINIKKLKNIRYDNLKIKEEEIDKNNKITHNHRNFKKAKSSSKIKLPLFNTFFGSSNKKKPKMNINKTFINEIQNRMFNNNSSNIKNNNKNIVSLKNNLLLNSEKPTILFPSNNLLFNKLESKKLNGIKSELSNKNKLIKKLNSNLIEQNKLAEEKISLLIKDKNKINEKLNLIQKEKDEYKNRKESEIKTYMQNLKADNKIIKELYNEKHKLMKSKRESELLNQKLKNIILEKRNELKNLYQTKKYSFDINMNFQSNNKYINNIKQKYYDINKENEEIKQQIIYLQKKLGINQKNGLNFKKYMNNIFTLTSVKKSRKPKHLKLLLTEKKEKIKSNENNSDNEEIDDDSYNFEKNDNKAEKSNYFHKKCHSENTNISNKDAININNEEVKIFNKYINIISENKTNQEKLDELQNELNKKNEIIKNLEKKIKEDLVTKDNLLETFEKEKNELKKLLAIETEKTIKLKKFAEEEQKKHIKYKNKLEKIKKKSKTEEKKLEKEENKKPEIEYFIYSNSSAFDENKSIAKLKEDIFKLKQLLDEEKNKNVILQLLSENQKEKNEIEKNNYDKTKKLNITLMNKIKEKEFSMNREIKLENDALKKQLVDTENKNEELKKIIKKLNDEIDSYKNKEKKDNKENNENSETKIQVNPINNIKGDKYKSEKKNYIGLFKNNLIQNKKDQRFSVQMTKPSLSSSLAKKPSDKKMIPKSNKDLITPKFDKDKFAFFKDKKNQKNNPINIKNHKYINSTSKKIPNNKFTNSMQISEFTNYNPELNLNNSYINPENSDQEFENKVKIQRRNKRESSEKVLRIFNGNNISSSEFSSEKNYSENNKGTQIGINNVIKENDNEDEDEKINNGLEENKEKNDNYNNNNVE